MSNPTEPEPPSREALSSWADDTSRGVEPIAPSASPIPQVTSETGVEKSRFRTRQYVVALSLIGLYAAANVVLGIGWFLGIEDVAIMAAAVGNIGTLVAAVVAFYFAETK